MSIRDGSQMTRFSHVAAPRADCQLCPRLAAFRSVQQTAHPDWFNAPVPAFGDRSAEIMIAGLAPGMRGANRTGRPFTGDFAGDLLYATLKKFGLSSGDYRADPDDGVELHNCIIVNAVRCLPPENKPIGAEIKACRPFLLRQIELISPKIICTLGRHALRTLTGLERLIQAFQQCCGRDDCCG